MLLICITPSIKNGSADPKILASFVGIADLLGVLEHSKFALNVAFFVRQEYFLHPKSGNLQKVFRETVNIYSDIILYVVTLKRVTQVMNARVSLCRSQY